MDITENKMWEDGYEAGRDYYTNSIKSEIRNVKKAIRISKEYFPHMDTSHFENLLKFLYVIHDKSKVGREKTAD